MEAERALAKRSRIEAELQLALVSRQHFADLSLLPQLVLGRACRGLQSVSGPCPTSLSNAEGGFGSCLCRFDS